MAVTITYLIMNLVRTYAIYLFVDNFLQKRRWTSNFFIIGGYGIYYTVAAVFYLNQDLFDLANNVALNLIFTFLIGCVCYKSSYMKSMLCSVFIYILSIASEDCALVIIMLIFNTTLSTALNNTHLVMLGITVSMSVQFALVKIVNPLFKRQTSELNYLYWFATLSIPAGSIYLIHSLVRQLEQGKNEQRFVLSAILILFALNILVFYLYQKLLNEEATKYENIMLHQQNEAYESQALLVQKFQRSLKEQNHDLHNHITTLKELAERKQINELLYYIKQWSKEFISPDKFTESVIDTPNASVNVLINSKLYMAQQQETILYANVDIPAEIHIAPPDLNVILGNLLDNALEACLKLPPEQRVIQCSINYMHNALTITVVNTYDKSGINIQDGHHHTTKKDTVSHGIGIKRVQQITNKYDGLFELLHSQHNGKDVFIAQVLLVPGKDASDAE